MKGQWNDEEIAKVLKGAPETGPQKVAFDRVWFKIEAAIEEKKKSHWHAFVWRPWNHPVRWVMAAMVCAVFLGVIQQRNSIDQADLASYVMSIADAGEDILDGDEIIQASALMSADSSDSSSDSYLFDGNEEDFDLDDDSLL